MSTSTLQGITGSVAACFATTCTYPIEVAKTRIQAGGKGSQSGFLAILFRILKTEGPRGLFVGLSSQYVQTFLANFFFFFFYSFFRKFTIRLYLANVEKRTEKKENTNPTYKKQSLPATLNLLIGVAAAIAQVLLITPVNVALTRIKTNSPPATLENNYLLPVLFKIAKREGVGRLYAGIGPSLVLTINPGLEFTIVEGLSDFYTSKVSKEEKTASFVTFIISAIAKIAATIMTYPYILAKVRMQNSGETSLLSIISRIFKADGVTGLYAGLQIQLAKAVLFAAIRNTIKEKIVRALPQ